MPGDGLVPKAPFTATRATTIGAPPSAVWPWVVQMGYRRAGWYTYDLLDNAGFASADVVLEEYQNPRVGDWMPTASKVDETTASKVRAFESNRWLLRDKPDSTWAWSLDALPDGGTRLVTRLKQRYQGESPALALFTLVLLEFGDFPMMRRVLGGMKSRAERASSAEGEADRGRTPRRED